jgi:hypothetical protein
VTDCAHGLAFAMGCHPCNADHAPGGPKRLALAADRLHRMAEAARSAAAYDLVWPLLDAGHLMRQASAGQLSPAGLATATAIASALLGDKDQESLP